MFQVASISVSEIPGKSRVAGAFDSLEGVKEGPGYLLWWAPDFFDSVSGRVTGLSVDTRKAVFLADAEIDDWNPTPGALRYLSDVRKPVHVWMISVPTRRFEQRVFQARDAFAAKRPPDAAPPLPTGEAVEFWLELTSAESQHVLSAIHPSAVSSEQRALLADRLQRWCLLHGFDDCVSKLAGRGTAPKSGVSVFRQRVETLRATSPGFFLRRSKLRLYFSALTVRATAGSLVFNSPFSSAMNSPTSLKSRYTDAKRT